MRQKISRLFLDQKICSLNKNLGGSMLDKGKLVVQDQSVPNYEEIGLEII